MTIVPGTSRLPIAPPLAMSTAQNLERPSPTTATAGSVAPSPLPPSYQTSSRQPSYHASKKRSWPKPRMRIDVQNAGHPAAELFFRSFSASDLLNDVVDAVLTGLYGASEKAAESAKLPPVRSITLVLRSMDGVAYTTGNDTLGDGDHKEIHFSLDHIQRTLEGARKDAGGEAMELDGSSDDKEEKARKRAAAEIHGVLTHEMVHVWQFNGSGTAPGGLIEGIADYVRLKEGLEPPHWNRQHKGDAWDAGYQTTAYFLDWCEKEAGEGKVRECNAWLRTGKYNGDDMWNSIFSRSVGDLWKEYKQSAY